MIACCWIPAHPRNWFLNWTNCLQLSSRILYILIEVLAIISGAKHGASSFNTKFYSMHHSCKTRNWCTWCDNKVHELIAVKVLHTSLLNTTMVTFKVLPLGSYAQMPAPSLPFKTILEMVLWSGLQSCRCINPDIINVIKMPSFHYFLYLREQKKVLGARSGE